METARKLSGRPFQKGQSGNPNGRPRAIATQALRAVITGDDLEAIWRRAIADARNGDKEARRDVIERLEGKAVTRSEQGEPGDFDLDLTGWSDDELKTAIRRLRKRVS